MNVVDNNVDPRLTNIAGIAGGINIIGIMILRPLKQKSSIDRFALQKLGFQRGHL